MTTMTRTLLGLALLGLVPAGASAQERAERGGRMGWERRAAFTPERILAAARECAEEQCAWKPVLLYFTADW